MGLRSALKALFQTGDKPTAAHYAELIDSSAHTTEDYDKMGGGLKEHVTTRPYKAGEAILVSGRIRISNIDQVGAYNANNWTDYEGDPKSLGIPAWDPEEEITDPVQRTHRNAIYEAIDVSQGIEPGVDPDWETYWVAVVYTQGGLIPVLTSGFVKMGTTYFYDNNDPTRDGGYTVMYNAPGFDGGYKFSFSDFDADVLDGKLKLRWKKAAEPLPYKKWVGLISQSGTDAPTAIVFENTFGEDIQFNRPDTGNYRMFFDETSLETDKIWFSKSYEWDEGTQTMRQFEDTGSGFIFITTYDQTSVADDLLNKCHFEVRLYP